MRRETGRQRVSSLRSVVARISLLLLCFTAAGAVIEYVARVPFAVFESILCALPWIIMEIIIFRYRSSRERREESYRALRQFGLVVLAMVCLALIVAEWQSHVANRTATVRAVFLHPADKNLGPQIYMNDGTVWALADWPEDVRMIQGDKVRYVFMPDPSEPMDSDSPDTCNLQDVTTGYSTEALRLSAPFKHSNCPAQ